MAKSSSEHDLHQQLPCPLPKELGYIPIGHPDSMMSVTSVRKAVEEFSVKPTDVIVATFPKTGTTLVTWICHQLRTGGHVDFNNIYEVVPWPTLSWDIGYDPNESRFSPRVFKSHLRMASIYRGCKYVVTIRDPAKTALSFYNFLLAKQVHLILDMDLSTFIRETPFVKGKEDGSRASLWEYYREYHTLLHCPSVLVLIYEDMLKDIVPSVRMLAKFMHIDANDELVQKVASMSTKEYMTTHLDKFDEPYERAKKLGRVGDLSQLSPGAKVVVSPHPQEMDPAAIEFLKDRWDDVMGPLGYAHYKAFADAFRRENEARFFPS